MGFKENLKSELSFQGILVKELSAQTGIKKRTIDNYLREKGNIPSAEIAVKIAEVLNVSVEFLVTGKDRKTSLDNSENYSADVRLLAKKISKMNENEKKPVTVVIDEIERQSNLNER